MTKKIEPRVTTDSKYGGESREIHEHDAFGLITLVKTSGRFDSMYGSRLAHQGAMCINIKRSRMERALSNDWYYGDQTIAEIYLTEAQWARFISSVGDGSGTPCTLRSAPDRGTKAHPMPQIDYRGTVREKHRDEFESRVRKAVEETRRAEASLREILNGDGKLTKGALREVLAKLSGATANLPSNLGFAVEQFEEMTERVVNDAKIEIEAAAEDLIRRTGLEVLRGGMPSLLLTEEPVTIECEAGKQ